MFYGQRNEKLDEAHLLNIQAVQLDPTNLPYRLNTANVLTQQGQYIGAISVLKVAAGITKSKAEDEMVQSRIKQLERLEASVDRAHARGEDAAHPPTAPSETNKTIVFKKVDGKIIGTAEETPNYPTGDSTGPQHTVKGILRNVRCSYPNVIALTVDQAGKVTPLYSNNYFKVVFTTANYEPDGDIKPCTGIEDMKASVKYAEVSDKNVAGQILAIELSK